MNYFRYFLRRTAPAAAIFFSIEMVLRFVFLLREHDNISLSVNDVVRLMGAGLLFDFFVFSCLMAPLALFLCVLPRKWHLGRFDRLATAASYIALIYMLLFDSVAEWVFWDEFGTRFNFIAVDYLVYTQEVLANLWESYPIVWIMSGIGLLSAALYFAVNHVLLPSAPPDTMSFRRRAGAAGGFLAVPLLLFFFVNVDDTEFTANAYVNEASKNGIYSLFSAFRNNELDYSRFYLTAYKDEELPKIRDLLQEDELHQRFATKEPDDITRIVPSPRSEKHKNVIIIVMESMGANFMARFGDAHGVTPELDALSRNSIFFANTYATGTRTVRGLEAVTLSIPPTPGQSIVRRPGNEDLASVGFVFRDRGYDTKFIYGGYGYFDNMNYFFAHNGFDVVDRMDFTAKEKTFVNAWGLCDEDIFNKVMSEADKSYRSGKPFMDVVMTISNHRPYTFPAGRVDAKQGLRLSAVKYADYAIGKLLEDAKSRPWFKDTVFVILADHTAGSAGKVELTQEKYHIPLFIYAPGFLKPREIPNLTSQIDVAPILLGLLDFNYVSRFYGENILEDADEQAHAFISNYEHLGFIDGHSLVVLRPGREYARYTDGRPEPEVSKDDDRLLLETIAYYKHASDWRRHMGRVETRPALFKQNN
jgi:phosphoglycerol transferase MdoB-like AlkP superfamily enzyme